MSDEKLTLKKLPGLIMRAVLDTAVFLIFLFIILAFVFPFILAGPNDSFWVLIRTGHVTYDSELVRYYLNILQWLAGPR